MNKRGFTLTELITVIVIIGVVLLIVIPVTTNIMEDNDKEKGMAFVQTLENAVNTYCDIYKSNATYCTVTYSDLSNSSLLNSSGISVNGGNFKRENGKVSNNDDDDELKVSIIINSKTYNCTKTSCEESN